jgi:hypothetical protein
MLQDDYVNKIANEASEPTVVNLQHGDKERTENNGDDDVEDVSVTNAGSDTHHQLFLLIKINISVTSL